MRKGLGFLVLLGVVALWVSGAALVTAQTVLLPPRPTLVPTAMAQPQGSWIELRTTTAPTTAWAVVEWQDAVGGWHTVEGWQGVLTPSATQTWWVAEADRGKGPFRWVVYRQRGGTVWGVSTAFHLPSDRRTVVVPVTATP